MTGEQAILLRGRLQGLSFALELPEQIRVQLDQRMRELEDARSEQEDADAAR